MRKFRYLLLAGVMLAPAACANLTGPSPQPTPAQEQTIEASFMAADAGLAALAFVPGLPPAIVQQASAVLSALEAAHKGYVSNPDATLQTQLQAAVSEALSFLASANAQPAVKAARAKTLAVGAR